jgi:hypothetical protein
MALRTLLAPLLLLGLALAGCSDAPEDGGGTTVAPPGERPALRGFVLDAALRPLEGAEVTVATANATARTDAGGHYAFASLAGGGAIVVVAQAPGFVPLGKSVQLSAGNTTLLNFTLEAVPTATPYMEKLSFNGFVACRWSVVANEEENPGDCSTPGHENADRWQFNVDPGVAGVVVEVAWEANNPASEYLRMTVETVGLGDQDAVLSEVEGKSVLRAAVTQAQGEKYYPEGGTVRVQVKAATGADEQEQAAGVGFTVEQDFQAIASIFYVEPPDPTYSATSG